MSEKPKKRRARTLQRLAHSVETVPVDHFGDPATLHPVDTTARRRREQLVREYVKDFNAANAFRRMGYAHWKTPGTRAREMLNEPYTQWYLANYLAKIEEKEVVSRVEVLAALKKQALGDVPNTGAERISALRTLAKILGMDVTRVEVKNTGGGVLAVPIVGSMEDWERMARESQSNLKQTVKE